MIETKIKSHLIITDVHDEFHMNWCGTIKGANPKIENGKPIFVVVGGKGRMELNTTDMIRVENCAKALTRPRGKAAFTSDTAQIYLKENDDKEKLLGVMTHNHIKQYNQMYDWVGVK